ncbi:DUF2637 domain-containing protein [Solwaraspora sp. WMMD1047]|uniref:DUF2637 domain-containing protein n=1 Tax=Solwaraspora sp. WMMD1047 TaxID=3016102 RepID=UPI002416CB69|nr:DUF2637 domain-containing protein [Solwaraspora sp. WMMD1047]MDG4828262.1 DUF2637 domain-containing protein [Solwaraspora sp. WMMD1047]
MTTRTERAEGVVLVAILLVVGGLAGAASFTHVHDWTMANSPAGTGDWFGWANAAISELIPLAALLTIRRRRRTGGPIGYPMFLLVAAVALSLSAQLAVAKPGPSGWLLSAVPALAFLGLSKLVLTVPSSPAAVPAGPHPSPAVPTEDGERPGLVPAQVSDRDGTGRRDGADDEPDGDQAATVDLVQLARRRAVEHRAATGRPITRDELRAALRVSNGAASELLRQIRDPDRPALVPVPAAAFATRNGTSHPATATEATP